MDMVPIWLRLAACYWAVNCPNLGFQTSSQDRTHFEPGYFQSRSNNGVQTVQAEFQLDHSGQASLMKAHVDYNKG